MVLNHPLRGLGIEFSWTTRSSKMTKFRSLLILEDAQGRVVAIEVKAHATVASQDFKSIKFLAEEVGKKFHRGLVLYTGKESIPFGPRLHALPVDVMWRFSGFSQPGNIK